MQDIEGRPIKLSGKSAEFTAKDFTTMNFATADDKAKWANKLTKFILGGFQRNSFKKEIYRQLHHMFGHCAEYDLDGFYHTWFEDTYKCLHWLETIATTWLAGIGQPQFTWSDVEIKLIQWIRDNNIRDQIAGYLQAETEQKERATLRLLQDRYGVVPDANAAEINEELTVDSMPVQIEIPTLQDLEQMKLF
jgi:hypothetical protein